MELISFIVGLETDVPIKEGDRWKGIYSFPIQMCQWTIASSPGHPILADVLHHIFFSWHEHSSFQGDVIEVTGPGPWTRAIYRYLTSYGIHWNDLREFGKIGRRIGSALILPITAFANGHGTWLMGAFGTMGAGPIDDPDALVNHWYAGSWRV